MAGNSGRQPRPHHRPIAERRAQALTLDRGLLSELLGQAELRELIDPRVLEDLERELQHLTEDRRARDPDEVQDLLRRMGDLTSAEIAERSAADPSSWLRTLEDQRRAVRVRIDGQERWIAAEDAGLYRDAFGLVPPPGLPDAYIGSNEAPLEHLLRRFARTHGPFPTGDAAFRFGLRPAQVEPVLRPLETQNILVRGEIRPLGVEPEWCDADVLRRLRRRTLARLRDAVAPVDAATLGRFLPAWQGIGGEIKGPDRLMEVILQLEGLTVSWSQLDRVLLPARVPGYRSADLDMLAATGRVVWVGHGALGSRDGRVALYRRERISALYGTEVGERPTDGIHGALIEHLGKRGACFLMELAEAAETTGCTVAKEDFDAAVWDLVWSGQVTNDTFAPLRNLAGRAQTRRRGRESVLAGGRWSLVRDLLGETSDTERLLACTEMLLERYGLVSREVVRSEAIAGGFGPIYRVLKQMEEGGRVRRGYFVEGLSGAQFALAGAVDRLRSARLDEVPVGGWSETDIRVLAATDPANPYGALLPWPDVAGGNVPKRAAGAWVILVAGKSVLFLSAGGKGLTSFPGSITDEGKELPLALSALQQVPRTGRRRALIQTIDGEPALTSPLRERMLAAGFEADYDALVPVRWTQGR